MLLTVALGKDIVFAWLESGSVVVPRGSAVWRPHSQDMSPYLR